MGLAYLGLSSASGQPLLSDDDIAKGLAAPLVAQHLLGTVGEYAMLLLILMAVMSTGSAEVIAVASVLIYDVYQSYIQPFRKNLRYGDCIICGKYTRHIRVMGALLFKGGVSNFDPCKCPSAHNCEGCIVSYG